ncbi:MAG: metal ABC transporter permease [Acidimicrobiales bacterium]
MTILQQLDSPLIRRALLEAVLVGALCGAVGVHVLLRRLPFFTLALSHATFPGVVAASLLGLSLRLGGAVAALALVATVAAIGSTRRLEASTATGVALSGAFALGVLLQSAQDGTSKDLTAFLVGDIFTVTRGDLLTTAAIGVAVLAALASVHKELLFSAFDPGGAAAAGYRPAGLELATLALVALTVVTSIQAVGTILVVALLVTPALAARLWLDRVVPMMVLGSLFGAASGVSGIAASAQCGIAGGAAIGLSATAILVVSFVASSWRAALHRRLPQKLLARS